MTDNLENLLAGIHKNGNSQGRDNSQNAFPVHSDEEDNVNEDEVPDLVDDDDDDEDEDLYESVDAQSFEDYPANDYAFQSGATEQSRGIEYWDNKSPLEIVLELAAGFFAVLLEMSNRAHPEAKLTMKDMYVYHAFLLLNCCFQFANLNYYWNTVSCVMTTPGWSKNGRGYMMNNIVTRACESGNQSISWSAVTSEIL